MKLTEHTCMTMLMTDCIVTYDRHAMYTTYYTSMLCFHANTYIDFIVLASSLCASILATATLLSALKGFFCSSDDDVAND